VSRTRFLVDENLSIRLPEMAHARGFEATHVNHHGLHKAKDWDILKVIETEDWVLVTNNVVEFRGRFRRLDLHPGVVFLLPSVQRQKQIDLFAAALDVVAQFPEMVNVEIDVDYANGGIQVDRYVLP
jgi:predicted nuclease of predicted toxin-antitoxin system